jgi:hypothetical protein
MLNVILAAILAAIRPLTLSVILAAIQPVMLNVIPAAVPAAIRPVMLNIIPAAIPAAIRPVMLHIILAAILVNALLVALLLLPISGWHVDDTRRYRSDESSAHSIDRPPRR